MLIQLLLEKEVNDSSLNDQKHQKKTSMLISVKWSIRTRAPDMAAGMAADLELVAAQT